MSSTNINQNNALKEIWGLEISLVHYYLCVNTVEKAFRRRKIFSMGVKRADDARKEKGPGNFDHRGLL